MTHPLREQVRAVLKAADLGSRPRVDAWMRGHDPEFTAALAKAGLIGINWPVDVGGRAASNVDRLVLTEELLRFGAPVAAHWIADRQIGPAILRHGSDDLQREFLPGIAAGEVTFCLGMSEPDSGSDLAAVRTRAVPVDGGWKLTGTKIWTSHAHRSTHAYVLARTSSGTEKHEGLSEFIVDLGSDGVTVRPIIDLAGEHHFNEMVFDDVFVPSRHLLGDEGKAWRQVSEQLSFERGGMERVLSTYPVLASILDFRPNLDVSLAALGTLIARLHTLRSMATEIAQSFDAGEAPIQQAALLKHLGTTFELEVVDLLREATSAVPVDGQPLNELLSAGITASPGATIRGGATEVLLTIVGREALSPRLAVKRERSLGDPDLADLVHSVLAGFAPTDSAESDARELWHTAVELGWSGIAVDDAAGGSGGDLGDLATVVRGLARHGLSAPIVDSVIAGRLLAASGRTVNQSTRTAIVDDDSVVARSTSDGWILSGTAAAIPWGAGSDFLLVFVNDKTGNVALLVPRESAGVETERHHNIAGEPRDTVRFHDVEVPFDESLGDPAAVDAARFDRIALLAAATLGALEGALEAATEHVRVREQFGKPLAAFQAVAHAIAGMTAEVAACQSAVHQAIDEAVAGGPGWRILAARVVVSRASSRVARTSHQLLGAMGVTHEHHLHRSTLRLWSWRDEQRSERECAQQLGTAGIAAGSSVLWDWCVHERADLGTQPPIKPQSNAGGDQ